MDNKWLSPTPWQIQGLTILDANGKPIAAVASPRDEAMATWVANGDTMTVAPEAIAVLEKLAEGHGNCTLLSLQYVEHSETCKEAFAILAKVKGASE